MDRQMLESILAKVMLPNKEVFLDNLARELRKTNFLARSGPMYEPESTEDATAVWTIEELLLGKRLTGFHTWPSGRYEETKALEDAMHASELKPSPKIWKRMQQSYRAYARETILRKAGVAVLAQANETPALALQLLR